MNHPNIFLIGLMAVGKSTVGRQLAEALDMPFYDSDAEVEARSGAEVSWIFDVEGESGFRDREEQVIDELSRCNGIVLATGGGAVQRLSNRKMLGSRGVVVHLDCPLHRLLSRTRNDKKRPLLQGDDAEEVLRRLMRERSPLYAEIADYRFVTDKQSAKVLVQKIIEQLRSDRHIE